MANNKKGRPALYPGAKQISILFPSEDFERMDAKIQREKRSYSDLIRRYVHQGLAREAKSTGREIVEIDPKASPKRQAFAIGRLAVRLAKELKE